MGVFTPRMEASDEILAPVKWRGMLQFISVVTGFHTGREQMYIWSSLSSTSVGSASGPGQAVAHTFHQTTKSPQWHTVACFLARGCNKKLLGPVAPVPHQQELSFQFTSSGDWEPVGLPWSGGAKVIVHWEREQQRDAGWTLCSVDLNSGFHSIVNIFQQAPHL